jgi:hypothetical protein
MPVDGTFRSSRSVRCSAASRWHSHSAVRVTPLCIPALAEAMSYASANTVQGDLAATAEPVLRIIDTGSPPPAHSRVERSAGQWVVAAAYP